MINEAVFAELIFPHTLQYPKTFCQLSQVSKRFNEVSKRQLVKKERINQDGIKEVWTELPNGKKHGLYREWDSFGQLWYEHNYQHGQLHGLYQRWYSNGQLAYESNYQQGQSHGLCRRWYEDGQLMYELNYQQGQVIEN
jgi:antitoxin component YwqK of YwqJK toxin-antitoxin module